MSQVGQARTATRMNDGKVQLRSRCRSNGAKRPTKRRANSLAKMGFERRAGRRRPAASPPAFRFSWSMRARRKRSTSTAITAPSARTHAMSMEEIDAFVAERIGRKVRVAGACIGTDAHTVGIDAILNMKGYKGDYGLERYKSSRRSISAARSRVEELVRFAKERRSTRCWPRKSSRKKAATSRTSPALGELLEAEGLRDRVVLICGGPRVTNLLASELGYDAGFGRGTLPSEVAAFIATTRCENVVHAALSLPSGRLP